MIEHRLKPGDRLVVATHNRGKLKEFESLLAPHGLGVLLAADLGLPEPDETGTTFEENARIKAIAAAEAAKMPALADDSGVAVDALGGEPGVYSARWAGPEKDFRVAMAKVEEKLREAGATTPERRGARFVAVLCLAFPDGATEFYRGEVESALSRKLCLATAPSEFAGHEIALVAPQGAKDILRKSQLADVSIWTNGPAKWDKDEAASYIKAIQDTITHPNLVADLRIAGFFEYVTALELGVSQIMAGQGEPQKLLDDVADAWTAISTKFGVDKQKALYLDALGVS